MHNILNLMGTNGFVWDMVFVPLCAAIVFGIERVIRHRAAIKKHAFNIRGM